MIVLKRIDQKTFDDYLKIYKHNHFLQTSNIGKRRALEGWKVDFLGFYAQEELIGALQLTKRNVLLNRNKYEILMGPLLNYSDLDQTKQCLNVLTNYLNEKKAIECLISPNIISKVHYPEIEIILDKDCYIEMFESLGWSYLKDSDDDTSTLRWFFQKDLTSFDSYQDLIESYEPETKRLISNAKAFPLKVIELEINNLERASVILDETGNRRDFSTRSMEYHKSLFTQMNKNNEAMYLVVELDVKAYLDILKKELKPINDSILADSKIDSKRARNRVNQYKDQLLAKNKRISQLESLNQETVDICSGVFIGANDTMTYLFGGSKKEFMQYYGTYFLQDYTLKHAYDYGYKLYDFYGTRSKISGYPEEEGIFEFKKGFGGKLVENLGYFIYKPKNIFNSIFEVLSKLKHSL